MYRVPVTRLFPSFGALVVGLCSPAAWAAGGVQVESSDNGASIYVDGADTGLETPSTVMGLSDGRHVVTVRNGCYVGEATVEITPMNVVPLNISLEPAQGSIAIQPVPSEATVQLDGETLTGAVGETTQVGCGPHTVQASLTGYLNTMITVDIEAGQHVVLPLELERLGSGSLRLDVTPNDASVSLDDKLLGVGDREVHGVVAGPHVLRATGEDGRSAERQFILEDGETLELSLELGKAAVASTVPSKPVKTPKERTGIRPTKALGYGMLALGAGAGGLAIGQWSQGRSAYTEYLDRAAAVNAGEAPAEYASDYHDKEVRPFRGPIYATSTAATLLLGGGVAFAFVF